MQTTKITPNPEIVSRFQEELTRMNPATAKRKTSSLKGFYEWANREGLVEGNPFAETPSTRHQIPKNTKIPNSKKQRVPLGAILGILLLGAMTTSVFLLAQKLKLPVEFVTSPAAPTPSNLGLILPSPTPFPVEEVDLILPTPEPGIGEANLEDFVESDPVFSRIYEIGGLLLGGSPITIATPNGTNGDINLNPDGTGNLNLIFEAGTGNLVSATAANLSSGALYYGYVGNNTSNYKLLELASGSSAKTRFSVDALGNTFIAGKLSAGSLDLTLDERGKPNTDASTLTLKRYNGSGDAYALFVDEGRARFDGDVTLSGGATFSGQGVFTRVPTSAHTGTWAVGSSTWNQSDATVYVNPASATADANLLGLAVGGSVVFAIDAEGDIYGKNLILTGTTTTGTTTVAGDLSVEGNTTLGDASSDTLTIRPTTITLSQTAHNLDFGNTGTLSFRDGTNALLAIKDQGVYPFLNIAAKTDTGDPATCAEGDMYYNDADDTIKICHETNTWEVLDGGGGFTDGGTYLYPTNRESVRVYDSGGTDYIDIAHDGTDTNITVANNGEINIGDTIDVTGDVKLSGILSLGETATPSAAADVGKLWVNSTNSHLYYMREDGSAFNLTQSDIGARVYNDANISISNVTETALTFNTERFDTDSIHSTVSNTGRLTANTAGKYLIWGNVDWAGPGGNDERRTIVRLNGSTKIASRVTTNNGGAGVENDYIVSTIYQLAANDYVELVVYHANGGPLNVLATGNYSPEFGMVKLNSQAGADVAEWYPSTRDARSGQFPQAGEIVSVGTEKSVSDSSVAYDTRMIGVVSTLPNLVLGNTDGTTPGYDAPYSYIPKEFRESFEDIAATNINSVPVALSGRVPVKISPGSAKIEPGDYITSSNEPGRGMKTKTAGRVIGVALEAWDPVNPKERILVFVNPTYFDPYAKLKDLFAYKLIQETLSEAKYIIQNEIEETVERVAAFSELVVANLRAGTVEVTGKMISPIVETELLSPIPGKDLAVKLEPTSKFVVTDGSDTEVASIDSQGNATFSGELRAQKVLAEEIVSPSLVSREEIEEILRRAEAETASDGAITPEVTDVSKDLYVENLAIGSDLVITPLAIETLTSPLRLQSLAAAPIEMMAGLVRVETNGDVKITGNLYVAGKIETNSLKAEEIATNKLLIAGDGATTTEASELTGTTIETKATAGMAVVPAGVGEITIKNPQITDTTLIYVTPVSTTLNNVLYIKSKEAGAFKVGFEEPLSVPVEFNWWMIDLVDEGEAGVASLETQ